jgi:hypothetical protein
MWYTDICVYIGSDSSDMQDDLHKKHKASEKKIMRKPG